MTGIPKNLYVPLREVLIECGSFDNDTQLRSVFAHELLTPWRYKVPQANNVMDRVDSIIYFLIDRQRADTQINALVLLLGILRDRTDPDDDCHERLSELAQELDAALNVNRSPARLPKTEEANPENQRMIFTGDLLRLVKCLPAVGKVSVPKILQGKVTEYSPTGTAWLLAPGLALTCWHVIKARSLFEGIISDADLQAQVINSLMTFDYTASGKGIEYRVAALECYDHSLDYALLRLEDRSDFPLSQRGVLISDVHVPLTVQTTLYVIQHPKGQPQQNSTGRFVRYKEGHPSSILHTAPSEPGTSGAPVLNTTNWSVIALHNGEDNDERLREATLLGAILPHIQRSRPELNGIITEIH